MDPWNPARIWNYFTNKVETAQQHTTTIVENAIRQIQETVMYSKKQIAASLKVLESSGAAITRKYLYELDNYVQPAKKAIAEAKKQGVDVTDCVEKEQALERLVDQVIISVNSCVCEQVAHTKKDVNKIYECSEQAIRDLYKDLAEMYNSDTMGSTAKVGALAAIKSTKLAMMVTARTGALYSNTQKRILKLPVTCGADVLAKFTKDLKQAAQDVEDCVAKNTCKHSSKL